MTGVRPEYRVAVFGLSGRFQRIVQTVFRDAQHNPYRFVLAASRGACDYDLALVDMTVKGGPDVARTLRRLPEGRPIVTVGRREDPTRARDDLVIQRFALNLIGVLNRTVEVHLAGPARRGAQALVRSAAAWWAGPDADRLLGRRPRALSIDASPAVRRQLALALHPMGVDSEGVGSAAEALDRLGARRFDLVFVEADLPDLPGLQFARALKRDPQHSGLSVVVLTHRRGVFDVVRGALAGCDGYLVKPVTVPTLRTTVARCMRRSLSTLAAREAQPAAA